MVLARLFYFELNTLYFEYTVKEIVNMGIDTTSNNFTILLLVASILTTVLVLVLLLLPRCRFSANHFLALFLSAIAITLFHQYLFVTGSIKHIALLIGFNLPLEFIFPPALYLYIRTMTSGPLPKKILLLHFVPILIGLILLIPFYVLDYETRFHIIQTNFDSGTLPGLLHTSFPIFVTATSIQAIVYFFFYFKLFSAHANNITRLYSYRKSISLFWLRNFLIVLIFIWLSLLLGSLFYQEKNIVNLEVWLYLFTAVVVVYIGVMGVLQSKIQNRIQFKANATNELNTEDYIILDKRLSTLMKTERPYLNDNLDLVQLADMLSISPSLVTAVIETHYHSTFFDFINSLRIDTARNIMINSAPHYTPLREIIKKSGFKSLTEFKHEYKKQTGESASHFEKTFYN